MINCTASRQLELHLSPRMFGLAIKSGLDSHTCDTNVGPTVKIN